MAALFSADRVNGGAQGRPPTMRFFLMMAPEQTDFHKPQAALD
jgi:hypothetical protein